MEDMLQCVQHGVNVIDLSTFFEREAGMVQLNIVDPSWLVFSGGFDYSTPRASASASSTCWLRARCWCSPGR